MNGKIGVFDSGLGGLSVLKELMKLLPNEDYLFYEDSIHNPYGVKSEEELIEITSHIVDYLLERDCKIIVIACNTATTSCMKKLRELYPQMIFVGTVPAIKVAYDSHCKHTIILSTPYTTKSKRVQELIHDYTDKDQELFNISGGDLAHLIELGEMEKVKALLQDLLLPYQDNADSIVLGCTHYSLIKKEIQEVLPNALLLDGCVGVSQEVKRQLESHHLLKESSSGSLEIVNDKSDDLITRSYEILEEI
ncbi:MAG: glutamate racemase [Bacilli bacterium]|nr:glutamate racemase [Bacilli bacterium]